MHPKSCQMSWWEFWLHLHVPFPCGLLLKLLHLPQYCYYEEEYCSRHFYKVLYKFQGNLSEVTWAIQSPSPGAENGRTSTQYWWLGGQGHLAELQWIHSRWASATDRGFVWLLWRHVSLVGDWLECEWCACKWCSRAGTGTTGMLLHQTVAGNGFQGVGFSLCVCMNDGVGICMCWRLMECFHISWYQNAERENVCVCVRAWLGVWWSGCMYVSVNDGMFLYLVVPVHIER